MTGEELARFVTDEALLALVRERAGEGAALALAERLRTLTEWPAEHDDEHRYGEIAIVAAALAVHGTDARVTDPHELEHWGLPRKHDHDRIRQLQIAAALLAAEIDRVRRRDGPGVTRG